MLRVTGIRDVLERGKSYIAVQGDPYHDYTVRLYATNLRLKQHTVTGTLHTIQNYRRSGLFDPPMVLKLEINSKLTRQELKFLSDYDLRNRIVVYYVKDVKLIKSLQELKYRDGSSPTALYYYNEWEEKAVFCENLIELTGLSFTSPKIRDQLVRLLIRQPEQWNMLGVIRDSMSEGYEISDTDLVSIFPDVNFVRIDDWIQRIIQGTTKRPAIEMYHYFREVKGYSSVWLWKKFQERFELVMLVYDAYRRGIIYPDVYRDIPNRCQARGYELEGELLKYKERDFEYAFRVISNTPYPYFYKAQKIVYNESNILTRDTDIMKVILSLQQARKEYNESIKEDKTK